MKPNKKLALFGYGRLGRLLAPILHRDFHLCIHDPFLADQAMSSPYHFVPFLEAAACEILLLAVPMCSMEEICVRLAAVLSENQLVLDTCSVKIHPLEIMKKHFPRGTEIIGTHPLFGPDSARDGLQGLKIVLCPFRTDRLPAVESYLRTIGLQVLLASPEEHDRAMAETQCLFHLMARAIQEMDIHLSEIATPGPEKLYRDFAILQKDTRQLFIDLQTLNPFAEKRRKELIQILAKMDSELTASKAGS